MKAGFVSNVFANLIVAGSMAAVLPYSLAQDNKSAEDKASLEAKEAADRSTEEIARWKFRLTRDPQRELTLNTKPILRWTNPPVGRVYGHVYVMTSDQYPLVIVGPYKWFSPYLSLDLECTSIAPSGIEGTRDGKTIWLTDKPGVEWKPVPGNPAVGKSPLERQRQMKKIAEDFTAELVDMRVNEKGEDQQLRQLTQPVYRYESETYHVIEGGIFAFVVATDPELFLILEALNENPAPTWRYGLARMNTDRIAVKFQNQQVWQCEKLLPEVVRRGKLPYLSINVAER